MEKTPDDPGDPGRCILGISVFAAGGVPVFGCLDLGGMDLPGSGLR